MPASKPRAIALAYLQKLLDAGETANLGRLYRDTDLAGALPATTVLYSVQTAEATRSGDQNEVMSLIFVRQSKVDGGDYMEIGDASERFIKDLIPLDAWAETHPAVFRIEPARAAISLAREDSNIVEARVEYRVYFSDRYGV